MSPAVWEPRHQLRLVLSAIDAFVLRYEFVKTSVMSIFRPTTFTVKWRALVVKSRSWIQFQPVIVNKATRYKAGFYPDALGLGE